MLTVEEIFPPFGLKITCGAVELRVLRDDDLPELVDLVVGGIQVPGLPMPFVSDWHEQPYEPGKPEGFPASSLRWWWSQRATSTPEEWRLALLVRVDGQAAGLQDLHARHFAQTRCISTGSWLGRAHQGKGVGTLMRQLVVGFAFDELGAQACESAYVVGNHASAAVSRKVGYVHNGRRPNVAHTRRGVVGVDEQQVVVTPVTYIRQDATARVEGAAALRRFLGISPLPPPAS